MEICEFVNSVPIFTRIYRRVGNQRLEEDKAALHHVLLTSLVSDFLQDTNYKDNRNQKRFILQERKGRMLLRQYCTTKRYTMKHKRLMQGVPVTESLKEALKPGLSQDWEVLAANEDL